MKRLAYLFVIILVVAFQSCTKELQTTNLALNPIIPHNTVMGGTNTVQTIYPLNPIYNNNQFSGSYFCNYQNENGWPVVITVSNLVYPQDANGNSLPYSVGDRFWGQLSVDVTADIHMLLQPVVGADNHFAIWQGIMSAPANGGAPDITAYLGAYNLWLANPDPFTEPKVIDFVSTQSTSAQIINFTGKLIRVNTGSTFAMVSEKYVAPVTTTSLIGAIMINGIALRCWGNFNTGVVSSIKTVSGVNILFNLICTGVDLVSGIYYERGSVTLPSGVIISGNFQIIGA